MLTHICRQTQTRCVSQVHSAALSPVILRETNMPLEALLQVGTHLPISLMWPSFAYIFPGVPHLFLYTPFNKISLIHPSSISPIAMTY